MSLLVAMLGASLVKRGHSAFSFKVALEKCCSKATPGDYERKSGMSQVLGVLIALSLISGVPVAQSNTGGFRAARVVGCDGGIAAASDTPTVLTMDADALERVAAGQAAQPGPAPKEQGNNNCQTFLAKKSADGVSLEKLQLTEGQVHVFQIGGKNDNLDLILPVGPGQAGNLVQAANEFMLVARCFAGEWRVQARRPNGTTRDLPPVKQTALASYTIRVNITGSDKTRRAFLIRGADTALPDDNAPVQDLFAGQVPLQPGDFAITTDTTPQRTTPSVHGRVKLALRDGWLVAQGRVDARPEAPFVLDTGSAMTTLDKTLLPADLNVEPVKMKEYSDRGVRELSFKTQGAGGEIQSFLGRATIPQLNLDELTFSSFPADVMSGLALVNSASGIIGQDILQRADLVNFRYPENEKAAGYLALGVESKLNGPDVIRLPFSQIGSHIFVRGKVNGIAGFFVLDTGSRESFLQPEFADSAGIKAVSDSTKNVRGLDDRPIPVQQGTAKTVTLGSREIPAVPFQIGNLPVLAQYGAEQFVGLLGNSFLRQFGEVEIDYRSREVRLKK